jgi:hypothetical protein
MAARYTVRTGSTALTAASTKSLILVAPGAKGLVPTQFSFSADGSAAAAGIGLELYRVTTLGSPAGTTGTVVKAVEGAGAALATALTILTTEPTTVEVIYDWFVTPFGGLYHLQLPLGREVQAAASGARFGLRYTTPSGVSPNSRTWIELEEG